MMASVPEFANRIFSTESTRSINNSASRISASTGSEKAVPSRICSASARVISGWAWPWIRGGHVVEEVKALDALDIGDHGAGAGGGKDRVGRKVVVNARSPADHRAGGALVESRGVRVRIAKRAGFVGHARGFDLLGHWRDLPDEAGPIGIALLS